MCNEIIKYAIERVNEVLEGDLKVDIPLLTSVMPPCVLDAVYKYEIKPLWDGGGLHNFLIDYKTGYVSIVPKHKIRCIKVEL